MTPEISVGMEPEYTKVNERLAEKIIK